MDNSVVVLGDPGVGKTTAVRKVCNKSASKVMPTLSIEFASTNMRVGQPEFLLKFWDTCKGVLIQLVDKNIKM